MVHRLLDAVYLIALVLLSPWLLWRAWRTGRYRQGVRDKLFGWQGEVPEGAVWFHGVSLGEVHVLRQLLPAFRARYPDRPVIVSSTTDTGLAEARKLFPDLVVFPYPFDFSWAVRATLQKTRPALVVLCESELWPNFLLTAHSLNIPVAVVNGRMSPRTASRYRLLAPFARRLFGQVTLWAVQTEEYAAGLLSLGAEPGKVVVTGNLKYDGATMDRLNPRTAERRTLFGLDATSLVWVVGSTQPPEEEIALGIFQRVRVTFPHLRLILVPRQPDRFDQVAELLTRSGVEFVRRSRGGEAKAPVILVDTTGELGAIWGLADVAFVGGSLDGKRGGQNMIEPAAYGAAVTFGPHVWNFKETARRLIEVGGAVQVRDGQELEDVTRRLLGDVEERKAVGAAARTLVRTQQGATQRTLQLLGDLVAGANAAEAA